MPKAPGTRANGPPPRRPSSDGERLAPEAGAVDGLDGEPFPLDEHELTLQAMSLNVPQCEALVADARARASDDTGVAWNELSEMCRAVSR